MNVNTDLSSVSDVLGYLQSKYGSSDFSKWQYGRQRFYSYVKYPTAGQATFNFFGDVAGANGISYLYTNMPKAGSFGQVHFWLNALYTDYQLQDSKLASWVGTDATAFENDLVAGFAQCGALTLDIQQRNFLQLPCPFLYASRGQGGVRQYSAGLEAGTIVSSAFTSVVTSNPGVDLATRRRNAFVIDPSIFIEAETNFQVQIQYPTGVVPIMSTTIVANNTNDLYVGVVLDGYVFRPQQ